MSVAAFLSELRSRDIQVCLDGNQLRCNAPAGVLTPALRDQLRQRKSDIIEFLYSAEALARQERAIVPLQPRGERAPVFAVGGYNGDVFYYRALAQHLGDDQPFFGLQPPGVDGHSEPLACVEDLAAYFAAQIRAFRPDGPYVIAGYCTGGTIAFELAQQLLEQGATIICVALVAAPYPTWYRALLQLRQRLAKPLERVSTPVGKLRSRYARPDAVTDQVLLLREKVERATVSAVSRYTPRLFAGRLGLFLPCKEWVRRSGSPLAWRSVAQRTEEYFGPDGCNGDNMLLEPNAPAFAELLRRCCEQS